MKISTKSILSPSPAREPSQISRTSSLSRRLKKSGSIKGGQASPMFPTGGKKRGSALENPEPSSPKVTCIGQVRVKTKKQGNKMRTGSQRDEVSFRKPEQNNFQTIVGQEYHAREIHQGFQFQNPQHECLPHGNQKWVHLPMTICEALRTFGEEFNCFLPCRSSCMTSEKDKEDKSVRSENGSSCGAHFARWLVALQDKDGKGREIELEVEEERTESSTSQRRQMFEGIQFDVEFKEKVEEEEARVPPKNALLLMRCRSDPVKMDALANCLWESPVPPNEEDNEHEEDYRDNETEQRDMEGQHEQVKVGDVAETELSRREEMYERCELSSYDEYEATQELENLIMEVDEKEEKIEEKVNQVVSENPERSIEIDGIQVESYELGGLKEDSKDAVDGLEVDSKDAVDGLEEDGKEEEQESDANPVAESRKEAVFIDAFPQNLVGNSEKIEELNKSELLHENDHQNKPPFEDEEVENRASFHSEEESAEHKQREDGEQKSEEEAKITEEPSEEEEILKLATENIEELNKSELLHENDHQNKPPFEDEEVENRASFHFEEESAEHKQREEAKITEEPSEEEEILKLATRHRSETENPKTRKPEVGHKSKVEEKERPAVPDCLLLMMCEPKLSMEVSKETWICSTDFIRWLPERDRNRKVKKSDGSDEPKKRLSIGNNKDSKPAHSRHPAQQNMQPSRSSCSFPVAPASMIDQKMVGSKAYEPFVLTRCKSEPMRSSAKLAQQEACFWNNRKLEPHRPATLGVGAAGVGF